MKKTLKQALVFLLGTILLTWAFYFPIPLFGLSPYRMPGMVLLIIGGSVPSWLGVIMVFLTYDKDKRKDYLQRCYQLKRIKPIWWLVLLALFPAIIALALTLDVAGGGVLPGMVNLKAMLANPILWVPLVSLSFMSGPFSEELGWRGYALDPLLQRFGFTQGSALLGLIWGIWHFPLFLMPETWHGRIGFGLTGFWLFVATSIGLSWIMSWVYINTERSILTGMLLHLSSNFSAQSVAGADGMITPGFDIYKGLIITVVGAAIALAMRRAERVKTDLITTGPLSR